MRLFLRGFKKICCFRHKWFSQRRCGCEGWWGECGGVSVVGVVGEGGGSTCAKCKDVKQNVIISLHITHSS